MLTENQINKLKVGDIIYSANISEVIKAKIVSLHISEESLAEMINYITVNVDESQTRVTTFTLRLGRFYLTENTAKKERVSLLENKIISLKIQLEAHTEELKILRENLG